MSNDHKNGTLKFIGQNPSGDGLTGIFSFVLYIFEDRGELSMKNPQTSIYFFGLNAYIQAVHREDSKLADHGVVIYTDNSTLPKLSAAFPLEKYPKLIFCIVEWPYFSNEKGILDRPLMRTLRFQAPDQFPHHTIQVRDADTLFVGFFPDKKEVEKGNINTKQIEKVYQQIYEWESTYIQEFLPSLPPSKKIIMGTHPNYNLGFHKNIPYAFPFSFVLETDVEKSSGMKENEARVHLYVKSNNLQEDDAKKKMNKTLDLFSMRFEKEPKQRIPYESNTLFEKRKELLKERKTLNRYEISNIPRLEAIDHELNKIQKEVIQQYMDTVPEKKRKIIPLYQYIVQKYMFKGYQAVYAGFLTITRNRKGIEDFWSKCVEYLFQHVKMTKNERTDKLVTTNNMIRGSSSSQLGRKEKSLNEIDAQRKSVYSIGKDERMLIWAIIPEYINNIFFFNVNYVPDKEKASKTYFYNPNSLRKYNKNKNGNPDNWEHQRMFLLQSSNHKEWLEDFLQQYPTEEAFLDFFEKNIQKRLVPMNIQEGPYKTIRNKGILTRKKGGKRKSITFKKKN